MSKKFFGKHFGKNEGKWIASIARERLMYNPSRLHPARNGTMESNDQHANPCVQMQWLQSITSMTYFYTHTPHTTSRTTPESRFFQNTHGCALNYTDLRKSYFGSKGKTESELRAGKAVVEHWRAGQEWILTTCTWPSSPIWWIWTCWALAKA